MNEFTNAIKELKQCIVLNPNDKKLRDDLTKLKEEEAKHNETVGSKMFSFFKEGIYNEKTTNLKKQRKKIVHDKLPEFDEAHQQCFIEFTHGHKNADPSKEKLRGKIVIELFDSEVPFTAENFRVLCTGEKSQDLYYLNKKVHRIVPNFLFQVGDISLAEDGTGGKSIYTADDDIHSKEGRFEDENVWYPHSHKGVLSTHVERDVKNYNGSQFMINLRDDNQYFDEKQTVFGRIIKGFDFLMELQQIERNEEKPVEPIYITDCGELRFDKKLKKDQADLKMYEPIIDPLEAKRERRRQQAKE